MCRSVLFVDDDAGMREVVRAILGLTAGFDVQVAGSGERALDLAFELRPDLILMDVMMPGMDGPSTLKRLRSSPLVAHIPVIFLTARVLPAEIAQLLQLGAIGVIGKPFDPRTLADELLTLWNASGQDRATRAAPGAGPDVTAPTRSLADSFIHRTRGEVPRLIELVELAAAGNREVLKEIERIAHSIHGAGAMFGFPRLSAAAGAIERLAEGVIAGTGARNPMADRALLQQLVTEVQGLAHEIKAAAKTAPSGGGLFSGLRTA
jgi:CheY-like chemotaxis protein